MQSMSIDAPASIWLRVVAFTWPESSFGRCWVGDMVFRAEGGEVKIGGREASKMTNLMRKKINQNCTVSR